MHALQSNLAAENLNALASLSDQSQQSHPGLLSNQYWAKVHKSCFAKKVKMHVLSSSHSQHRSSLLHLKQGNIQLPGTRAWAFQTRQKSCVKCSATDEDPYKVSCLYSSYRSSKLKSHGQERGWCYLQVSGGSFFMLQDTYTFFAGTVRRLSRLINAIRIRLSARIADNEQSALWAWHIDTPKSHGCVTGTQVLGISVKADSAQVNRVYKKKMAEVRGNEVEMGRVEAAHTKIMMSGLSSRLSVRFQSP